MNESGPTWIVLIRDLSETAPIDGEPRTVASLVLDADTGLIRGVSIGKSETAVCAEAMRSALTKPAADLPPGRPSQVVCGMGIRREVGAALTEALGHGTVPEVTEVVSLEAEDIFDSLVGHMTGRRQPVDPADPGDWQMLVSYASDYCRAEPWARWTDDMPLEVSVRVNGETTRYVAVVLGHEGVQRGLVLYPGRKLPHDVHEWEPGTPPPLPAGTVMFYLDPPAESPKEFVEKAARYGWPADLDLVPLWLTGGPDGPADLDRTGVHRLTIAIAAVVAHDQAKASGKTSGKVTLASGQPGSYVIS
jgi:hypothetical protein